MKLLNNNFKTLVFIFSIFLTTSFAKAQSSYIQSNLEIAQNLSDHYGIPTSVILAVAIVETGGGTSKNSKVLNNHFGIVGKNTVNNSKYKSFSSVKESYEAFCKLLTKKSFFSRLKNTNDFTAWAKAIASAGYSTQPAEWSRRLHLIFNKFNLSSID